MDTTQPLFVRDPEEENRRLRENLRASHESYMQVARRLGRCEHLALSAPNLPCPHPECCTLPPGERYLTVADIPKTPLYLTLSHDLRLSIPQKRFERTELEVDGVRFWAWRPVP